MDSSDGTKAPTNRTRPRHLIHWVGLNKQTWKHSSDINPIKKKNLSNPINPVTLNISLIFYNFMPCKLSSLSSYQLELWNNVACCILETSTSQAHSLTFLNDVGALNAVLWENSFYKRQCSRTLKRRESSGLSNYRVLYSESAKGCASLQSSCSIENCK